MKNKKIISGVTLAIILIGMLIYCYADDIYLALHPPKEEHVFKTKPDVEVPIKEILNLVYNAMDEKGYNPVNQIVGYIMSGDPTYITSHKGARSMIMKVERDELVEELLTEYIKNKSWER